MAATITVTGVIGPAGAITAGVFPRCTEFTVLTEQNLLSFVQDGVRKEIAIASAATVTATKSSTTWTLNIS